MFIYLNNPHLTVNKPIHEQYVAKLDIEMQKFNGKLSDFADSHSEVTDVTKTTKQDQQRKL